MFAKRFFYVCSGLFLLALSYHLGARSASAQSPQTVSCGAIDFDRSSSDNLIAAVVGRTYCICSGGGTVALGPPIPGTDAVVGCSGNWLYGAYVILANGDVYRLSDDRSTWGHICNITGGAVNVERHTLGQLKARFRDPAPVGR